MRSLVAIRAHRPTAAVARLHDALSPVVPDGRLVVVADELHGAAPQAWPSHYDVVGLDDDVLDAAGIRTDIIDAGWRCGDYAYVALASAGRFEHAWLIEPDVAFTGPGGAGLLDELDRSAADLVAADIRPAPDWLWAHQLTSRGVLDPWRCFFPLTRLSRRAIDAALALRLRIQWLDGGDSGHPNDESVVATAVMTGGLSGADLRAARPDAFAHFHHRPKLMTALVAEEERTAVIHPALEHGEFVRTLRRELLRAGRDDVRARVQERRRHPAGRTLETLSDHALLTERQAASFAEAFGDPDAQYGRYDAGFRRRVLDRLPVDVRALVGFSGALSRTRPGAAASNRPRP